MTPTTLSPATRARRAVAVLLTRAAPCGAGPGAGPARPAAEPHEATITKSAPTGWATAEAKKETTA
ncbi:MULTISPECIES: hypothetical protein [unclassified Streptomyces]|uniref:hypothetical protein n=1 Tax=unclassified Streptomyces TaxID=2593676 RepID=UPI0038045D1F